MLLRALEQQKARGQGPQLPLFGGAAARVEPTASPPPPDAIRARLTDANPDTLSPREALNLVYELRDLLDS